MRIAQIAPIIERVPPKKYGGIERVVSTLTEGLVKAGHDVTLFASGDSVTSAKLISVYSKALREVRMKDAYGLNDLAVLNIGLAYKMQDEFDIIHDHTGHYSLPVANLATTPVVNTLHGAFTSTNKRLFETLTKPYLVAISREQVASSGNIKIAKVIYNGLEMEHYPFNQNNEGYLLFVGRISMEKGVHHAIEVALTLDLPLIIAAKLDDVDLAYFREYVEPHLSEQIKWVGEVNEGERNNLMSKALCFLHPVTWKEPFGLVLIEAMACGSPVVAFNKGSIPEIIKNNRTGFVVNDVEEMIEAVSKIKQISRAECRQHSLKNFNADNMVQSYIDLYQDILNHPTLDLSSQPAGFVKEIITTVRAIS